MKNLLQEILSTQYQIISVNFLLLWNCSYIYATIKKKSSKGTLKTFKKKFLSDLTKVDWNTLFSDCKQHVDLSYKQFLQKVTKLFDIHPTVKKLSHKEKNSLPKPWLTKGVLHSIKRKNGLYRNFLKTKDSSKTELLLQNFKLYKNTIHKLTRINNTANLKKPGIGLNLLSALRQTLTNKWNP